jgi:hypothetical protein
MTGRVLIGCEHSGTIRDAFRARGIEAVSCDLLDTDRPGPHITGDIRDVLWLREPWSLFIVHPDCTYLTASGLHWNVRRPERRQKTEEALQFVRDLIELSAYIPRFCMENPVGRIGTAVRAADQYIQPFEFGHDASKRTCLWLRGLPPLVKNPADYIPPRLICAECGGRNEYDDAFGYGCRHCGAEAGRLRPRWGNQTDSGQNRLPPSKDRWKLRSLTYPGWADAMADQWAPLVRCPA